ncbi:hypothetical protein [Rhodococcus sp. KRD162]|uniref:hypothetical protein n=1 Tax=Rhodococcus sp. KRD162 TaxID=2729725 RepID=UPI0019D09642|nr:hypothetical protein [Rhodococcus sp. KRD162]
MGVDLALGVPPSVGLGFALPQQESMPYIPGGTICIRACWGASMAGYSRTGS